MGNYYEFLGICTQEKIKEFCKQQLEERILMGANSEVTHLRQGFDGLCPKKTMNTKTDSHCVTAHDFDGKEKSSLILQYISSKTSQVRLLPSHYHSI